MSKSEIKLVGDRREFAEKASNPVSSLRLKRNNFKAFTLIEMVVATFILSIVIVAVMGTFSTVTKANSKADSLQTSALLARIKLAETEQQVSNLSGGETQGDFGDDFAGYSWRQTVDATDYEKLFKVTVTIIRGGASSNDQNEYATYFNTDQNVTDEQIKKQQAASGSASSSGSSSSPPASTGSGGTNGG